MRLTVDVEHEVKKLLRLARRFTDEGDFTQVVLEGIQQIQYFQRRLAPIGKEGTIPRSIKPARIVRTSSGAYADSVTQNPRAIFTNEGTGTHRPSNPAPYEIVQERRYQTGSRAGERYTVNILHPGIRGTGWWERGADMGADLAEEAFRRKVERMMR